MRLDPFYTEYCFTGNTVIVRFQCITVKVALSIGSLVSTLYLCMYVCMYVWLHWVFIAVRRLFSSCGERGLLFVVVRGHLIAVASLVVEHGL